MTIEPEPLEVGGLADGGLALRHPPQRRLPLVLAPTDGQRSNTVREPLTPIACWRIDGVRFAFDSSFLGPESRAELAMLGSLRRSLGAAPMAIFGHADPVGDDAYNRELAARRARAVHAVITRDVDAWAQLFDQKLQGDDWGVRALQLCLEAIGLAPGPIDGLFGQLTAEALRAFQSGSGIAPSGFPDRATRAALFEVYMDHLCWDGSGAPFRFVPEDFLGNGADAGHKQAVQSCGELNPVYVMSQAQHAELSASGRREERNAVNAPNRRVTILFFRPGAELDASSWPCPRLGEPGGACASAAWPDGSARRSATAEPREHAKGGRTFSCAFYDRLARTSPCETRRRTLRVRLLDASHQPIPFAPYRLELSGVALRTGVANGEGVLEAPNVPSLRRVEVAFDDPRVFKHRDAPMAYRKTVWLDFEDADEDLPALGRRLRNLGYPDDALDSAVASFQSDYGLPPTGVLDVATKAHLIAAHDRGEPGAVAGGE